MMDPLTIARVTIAGGTLGLTMWQIHEAKLANQPHWEVKNQANLITGQNETVDCKYAPHHSVAPVDCLTQTGFVLRIAYGMTADYTQQKLAGKNQTVSADLDASIAIGEANEYAAEFDKFNKKLHGRKYRQTNRPLDAEGLSSGEGANIALITEMVNKANAGKPIAGFVRGYFQNPALRSQFTKTVGTKP